MSLKAAAMQRSGDAGSLLRRKDDRIIIHFDYDAFYASVFEAENPALRSQALGVQQKQILVTVNYEARRRGLHKLQLITEAKRMCPDVVIVLGEDLTRFRNASKMLYNFLRGYSWNDKVERLGFDEVWMDVTDIIDYNFGLLNDNDLRNSFFQLSKSDPTAGFVFNATILAGHGYPRDLQTMFLDANESVLMSRLILGSHLAMYLRHQLEEQKGYTSTVGISTTKLISKLVGNVNKPKGQTTLIPPYEAHPEDSQSSNIISFLDGHEIGSIPYVGFKASRKLRDLALGRVAEIETGLVYGIPKEKVTVGDLRRVRDMSPELLEKVLSGPGMPQEIGARTFASIHGVDGTEVTAARNVPRQISIEDSYMRLDRIDQVNQELHMLSQRLIERMRIDLTEEIEDGEKSARWMAHPTTLRLSSRARPPLNADGTRQRNFNRTSRSTPLPRFVFGLSSPAEELAHKLVHESIMPLFKKLHPEKSGWNLSLLNVAVTGMDEEPKGSDLDTLFRKQQDIDREREMLDNIIDAPGNNEHEEAWEEASDDELLNSSFICATCGSAVPTFAKEAHERFHMMGS